MIKSLIFFIFTLGLVCPSLALEIRLHPATSFSFSEEDVQKAARKVYEFVNARIPDPQPEEKIEIFLETRNSECTGFVSRSAEDLRKIYISSEIKSLIDLQVILAHELTHVFRHHFLAEEAYWLDEGLAKWMEWNYIGEFPQEYLQEVHKAQYLPLQTEAFSCRGDRLNYAVSYFFILYLYNHLGGISFLREVAQSPLMGWENIENSARRVKEKNLISIDDSYLNRHSFLRHFAVALKLNDPFRADFALLQLDARYKPSPQTVLRVQALPSEGLCEEYALGEIDSLLSGRVQVCLPR